MRWTRVFSLALAGAAAVAAATPSTPRTSLPWIEDDASRAFSEAKSKKLPIFVEVWAPW